MDHRKAKFRQCLRRMIIGVCYFLPGISIKYEIIYKLLYTVNLSKLNSPRQNAPSRPNRSDSFSRIDQIQKDFEEAADEISKDDSFSLPPKLSPVPPIELENFGDIPVPELLTIDDNSLAEIDDPQESMKLNSAVLDSLIRVDSNLREIGVFGPLEEIRSLIKHTPLIQKKSKANFSLFTLFQL